MESYINLKKINFLIIISFFPIFITRSNLNIHEIIYTLFIFMVPALLINYFIVKKKLLSKFF